MKSIKSLMAFAVIGLLLAVASPTSHASPTKVTTSCHFGDLSFNAPFLTHMNDSFVSVVADNYLHVSVAPVIVVATADQPQIAKIAVLNQVFRLQKIYCRITRKHDKAKGGYNWRTMQAYNTKSDKPGWLDNNVIKV